jgi:rhamnosyltransferase
LKQDLRITAKVVAIVVTFEPDLDALFALLEKIDSQVDGITLIDNGSSNAKAIELFMPKVQVQLLNTQFLDQNVGLAAAQNLGLEFAEQEKATHVILFDQDSLPTTDMVAQLLSAELALLDLGKCVAAVGPCYLDERQKNPPPFISIVGLRLQRHNCENREEPVEVEYLIASGSLIRTEVIRKIGNMRADFFIDYIDIEWGLRAKHSGFTSFGVCSAKMNHSLGDTPIVWMGKNIPMHSPTRHYFHFRNAVRLYCESGTPLNWKLVDGYRLVLKFFFYSLFAKPRFQHFSSMIAGIRDGILGKGGSR